MNIEEITEEERIALAKRDLEMILGGATEAKKLTAARVRAALALREDQAIKLLVDFNRAREDLGLLTNRHPDFSSALLALDTPNVAPGEKAIASALPQCIFKGLRLVVLEDFASAFDVTGVFVGVRLQHLLSAAGSIPARLFTPRYALADLEMDFCQISQQIAVHVINTSDKSARFRALLFGKSIR